MAIKGSFQLSTSSSFLPSVQLTSSTVLMYILVPRSKALQSTKNIFLPYKFLLDNESSVSSRWGKKPTGKEASSGGEGEVEDDEGGDKAVEGKGKGKERERKGKEKGDKEAARRRMLEHCVPHVNIYG